MNISDPYLCSTLIRGITDQIAASAAPPKPDATVNQLIQRVTQTSAWAKTIMRKALSEQYADVGWSRSEAQPDNGDISADASPYWVSMTLSTVRITTFRECRYGPVHWL